MLTRSKTANKIHNHRSLTHKRGQWEEVYGIVEGVDGLAGLNGRCATKETPYGKFQTTYYQTYGGGPEGGYFIDFHIDKDTGRKHIIQGAKVHRGWFEPFTLTDLPFGTRIEMKERYGVPHIRVSQPVKYH